MSEDFLNLSKYEIKEKIGEGSFGEVFIVQDKITKKILAAKISLKALDENDDKLMLNLKREINIMSQIKHPSILKFIGYSPINFKSKNKPVILTEYSRNGTLEHILNLERQSLSPLFWDSTKKLINIYGIASAMAYLHSNNIIHRDLKPANILEDDYIFPKVADFGLSKSLHQSLESQTTQSTVGFKGTPKYMAPEIWENNEYSKSVDVYAFSIISYEILTGEDPFKNFTFPMMYSKIVIQNYRPEFNCHIPDCYKTLICRCWSKNSEERPTFNEIVDELRNNQEFITENIDRDEFLNYVDFIENSDTSFDFSKKFRKVDLIPKESEKVKIIENNQNEKCVTEITSSHEFKNLPQETQEIIKSSLVFMDSQTRSIIIPSEKLEILLCNKSFELSEFRSILNKFFCIFEIQHPSPIFESAISTIKQIMKIVKSIKIIIETKTDFSKFPNIEYPPFGIKFDSSIKKTSFKKCDFLTEVWISPFVQKIGNGAFEGCENLVKVSMPSSSSLSKIGEYSFCCCSSLTQIDIPSSVKKIGEGCFHCCSSLTQIMIPSSVTKIGSSAFFECSSLKEIVIPSSVIEFGDLVFGNCSSLEKVTICSTVNLIGNSNFSNCRSLKKIEIPSSVTEICESAFLNCSSLEEIEIPNSVTHIGESAFCGCSSLKEITIPPSVSVIGESAFSNCDSLRQINILSNIHKINFGKYLGIENNTKIVKISDKKK